MKYFGDNSLAKLIALIKDTLSAHTDDTSIHVTAAEKEAWENAGKPFVIEGMVSAAPAMTREIVSVNKTRAEIKAAVQAGESVVLRINSAFELPLTGHDFNDYRDLYYFGTVTDGPESAELYYSDTVTGVYKWLYIPILSDDVPSAPGAASAGVSYNVARADHVHPSERPKATLVTLTTASWDASTKTQTVDVAGIDADESKQVIYVMPYSSDTQAYKDAGIQMSAQAAGKATFTCESVPTGDISAWVVVEDVYDVTEYPPAYLTFSSPSAFSVSSTPLWDGTMEYSTDTETWNTWNGAAISGAVNGGQYTLYIRGTGNTKVTGSTTFDDTPWVLTGSQISCFGNIETLLDYSAAVRGKHPTMADMCYLGMFANCTNLVAAPELPATTLSTNCYTSMFQGCINLASAPALLSTTLELDCYAAMFQDCINLTTAPALPATILADGCYTYMFAGCIRLTTPPELPATTLADNCYSGMFSNCPFEVAPTLPATTLAPNCYSYMFFGCRGLTTAPSLPATTLTDGCYSRMFANCVSLATLPSLPAITLTESCYEMMFAGCVGLKGLQANATGGFTKAYRIPSSGSGTSATNSLNKMFTATNDDPYAENPIETPTINTTYYVFSTIPIV